MTTSQGSIACALTSAGQSAQAERWRELMARAVTGHSQIADGVCIWFGPEAEEYLRALVAAETECCPWATWTVAASAGKVMLEVRSTAEGVAALHGMFGPAC